MNGILFMNVKTLEDQDLMNKGMSFVSAERKEKIQKFKSPLPARLSLGAGVLLYMALEKNGYGNRIRDIQYGEHGKPYLKGVDFHFSLSHSGEYAVCAYGVRPLGIDFQKIRDTIPKHTKKILSKSEEMFLNSLEPYQKIEAFYRIWARKESLIKWDGRGLKIPLYTISVIEDNTFKEKVFFEDKTVYLKEMDFLMPDYAVSICAENEIDHLEIMEVTSKILTNY